LWLGYGDWLSGPHAADYADRRGEDVDLLVSHFLAEACGEAGKRVELAAAARARPCDYVSRDARESWGLEAEGHARAHRHVLRANLFGEEVDVLRFDE